MTLEELKTYLETEYPVVDEDGTLLVTVTNPTGEVNIFYVDKDGEGFSITESSGTTFAHCLDAQEVKSYLERFGQFPAA